MCSYLLKINSAYPNSCNLRSKLLHNWLYTSHCWYLKNNATLGELILSSPFWSRDSLHKFSDEANLRVVYGECVNEQNSHKSLWLTSSDMMLCAVTDVTHIQAETQNTCEQKVQAQKHIGRYPECFSFFSIVKRSQKWQRWRWSASWLYDILKDFCSRTEVLLFNLKILPMFLLPAAQLAES